MLIISAAKGDQIDLADVQSLVQRFDHAQHPADLDRVAEEASRLVGGRVQSLLRHRLKGFNLAPDEIISLSDRVIRETLEGTGRTRLKRTDIVPEELVEQMQTTPVGQKLWNLLSDGLKHELGSTPYLRADIAQKLVNEINVLLDRPDLAEQLGIGGTAASESAIQRTRDNASMLASALPAIGRVEDRPVHFWGYLQQFALPNAVRDVTEERGRLSATDKRSWDIISPVVQALEGSLGHPPMPEEVHVELRRQSQEKYSEAIRWIEDRIREIQPENPFKIKDDKALSFGKKLLIEHGVPEDILSPGGQHYVPKSAVKMPGLPTIQRLMSLPGLMGPHAQTAPAPLEQTPAPSSAQAPEQSSWARQIGQDMAQSGRSAELYQAIVDNAFAVGSVERMVGEFLAHHPDPTDQDVDAFLKTLDTETADYLRLSWRTVVHTVDRAVASTFSDDRLMSMISTQFGYSPSSFATSRNGVRLAIFIRNNRLLRYAS